MCQSWVVLFLGWGWDWAYPRAFREELQSDEENQSWDALNTPCDAEGSWAVHEGASVGDEVHDQDTPFDRPLLDTDDTTSDRAWGQFGKVHADLRRGDTNCTSGSANEPFLFLLLGR